MARPNLLPGEKKEMGKELGKPKNYKLGRRKRIPGEVRGRTGQTLAFTSISAGFRFWGREGGLVGKEGEDHSQCIRSQVARWSAVHKSNGTVPKGGKLAAGLADDWLIEITKRSFGRGGMEK